MEKKVLTFAMVMGMGVSAFAQEVVTDSIATDSAAVNSIVAFYEPTDTTVCDSTVAFYEPTDTTVCDSTVAFYEPTDTTTCDSIKTCPSKAEFAQTGSKEYDGAAYSKASAKEDENTIVAVLKRENEMA